MKIIFLIFSILIGLNPTHVYSQITPRKIKKTITKTYQVEPTLEPSGRSIDIFDEKGNELESITYDEHDRIILKFTNVYDSLSRKIEYINFWQWFIPHDYGGGIEEAHYYYFYDQLGNLIADSVYSTHNGVKSNHSGILHLDPYESLSGSNKKYNSHNDLIEEIYSTHDTAAYEYAYNLYNKKTKSSYFVYEKGKPILMGTNYYYYDKKQHLEKDSSAYYYTDTMTVVWVHKYDDQGNSISAIGNTYSNGQRHPTHLITHKYIYDKEENWIEWETIDSLEKTREITKRSIEYY